MLVIKMNQSVKISDKTNFMFNIIIINNNNIA